ncbi:MAG TPA: D-xylose ABC transporter substrate-binding protein [Candidatus Bathyarchaeia archaeon]|nr:D-xylose ABC transporter substrate-binding protein [Candidatus Bathyarchaeia archaeon]
MRQPWKLCIAILLLSVFLSACNTSGTADEAAEDDILVGFSMDNLIDERWQKDRDLFEDRVKALGGEVLTLSAEKDDAKQIAQVESLIEQGVDVLVVLPHNGDAMVSVLEKARQAGIKIVAYDRLIKNMDLDFYVSFDNEKVGELQAAEIVKRAPQGNYVYIGGAETDNNAILFRNGAMKVLKQQPGIQVVFDQYSKDWKPSEALKHMEAALAAHGTNIQAVVAANDGTAGGAIEALTARGLAGKVPVSGQDAELAALQRIVEGKQTMTIYKPIQQLAEAAAEAAVSLAKNEEVKSNRKVNNGKVDVPANLLEPIVVTKENVASTVIKDGYHQTEDVYKRIPKDQWPTK